jgi:hypothetical protein
MGKRAGTYMRVPALRSWGGRLTARTLIKRLALALAGIVALNVLAHAEPKPDPRNLGVREIEIKTSPILYFDRSNAQKRTFGRLTFLGGLTLTSAEKSFGGWSGLAIEPGGKGIVAVSDAGLWMTARLVYQQGRPVGIEEARIGPLKALSGEPLHRERDRDAEAVELVSGTLTNGSLLIAFEQNHRIGRFDIDRNGVSAPHSYVRPPKRSGRMSALKGYEAVTVLTKGPYRGSLLAIAERKHDGNGHHTGWLWSSGKANAFSLTDIGGFDITGVAILPDGDLLVLERRFTWLEGVKMRLRRIALRDLKPGADIEGDVLLEATMAQDIDNMEGIAVHQDSRGNAIITLISDDNFNRLFQRSILLQFRLDADRKSAETR